MRPGRAIANASRVRRCCSSIFSTRSICCQTKRQLCSFLYFFLAPVSPVVSEQDYQSSVHSPYVKSILFYPVFQHQARNPLKLPHIIGYRCRAYRSCSQVKSSFVADNVLALRHKVRIGFFEAAERAPGRPGGTQDDVVPFADELQLAHSFKIQIAGQTDGAVLDVN